MNRLRAVMAADADTQTRLTQVVRLVAGTMVADVCSIYRRTEDDRLELIATEGLRQEAVHRTFLALNEGLVGQIAQTVGLNSRMSESLGQFFLKLLTNRLIQVAPLF